MPAASATDVVNSSTASEDSPFQQQLYPPILLKRSNFSRRCACTRPPRDLAVVALRATFVRPCDIGSAGFKLGRGSCLNVFCASRTDFILLEQVFAGANMPT